MRAAKRLYARLPLAVRQRLRAATPAAARRWWAHRQTDVYLISYPKCGRTWLRLMLGRAWGQHYGLPESEELLFLQWREPPHPELPRLTVVHEDRPMLKAPAELETSKARFHNKRVIFLARDPRDVIVSSYFEKKKRSALFGTNPYAGRDPGFSGTLEEFIAAPIGGFDTLLRFYNIWAQNRGVPAGFLLVRYEDLRAAPAAELRRILDFLGTPSVSAAVIDEAVAYAAFDRMRQMEAAGSFSAALLQPANQADPESFKTRKGKVGGYREHLSAAAIAQLDAKMAATLDPFFGYTPGPPTVPSQGTAV
jgi:hypothetical protein